MSDFFKIIYPRWGMRPDYHLAIRREFTHYAVNFEASGQVELDWTTRPKLLSAPLVWMKSPGQYGACRRAAESRAVWKHMFVAFQGGAADEWNARGLLDLSAPLAVRDPRALEALFVRLFRTLDHDGGGDRANLALLEILLYIQEEKVRVTPSAHYAALSELVRRWREDPAGADMGAAVREIGISESHFRRLFTHFAGASPTAFVNRLRLEQAARMICADRRLPLKAAAQDCGCSDIYYFGKAFKREFGVPPGTYRRRYGE